MNSYRAAIAVKLAYIPPRNTVATESHPSGRVFRSLYDYTNQYSYLKKIFGKQREEMDSSELYNYNSFVESMNEFIENGIMRCGVFRTHNSSVKFNTIEPIVENEMLYLHLDVCTDALFDEAHESLLHSFNEPYCVMIQLALPDEVPDHTYNIDIATFVHKPVYRCMILDNYSLVTICDSTM